MFDSGAKLRESRFDRLDDLRIPVAREAYLEILSRGKVSHDQPSPEYNANSWLRECYDAIKPLLAESLICDLEVIARQLADKWAGPIRNTSPDDCAEITAKARSFCAYLSLPYPKGETDYSSLLRLTNARWWRKQINVAVPRVIDQTSRKYGQVNKARNIYLSDSAFKMWQSRQSAARDLLESMVATNDVGQQYTLAELSEKSISNPHIRRTELMVRMRGLEEYAQSIGFDRAQFITITAPSKYHAFNQRGIQNVKWNHSNPRIVNDYLNGVWARVRARLDRQGVQYFGVRVAEPHHDGCPHWHILVFSRRFDSLEINAACREYALQEDGNEKGARSARCVIVPIKGEKGSAVGYIAKYISKSIDGRGIQSDLYDKDAKSGAVRIRAWASTWGIRQFQFFGSAAIGPWRELRRVRRSVPEPYESARLAADQAEFARFLTIAVGSGFAVYRQPFVCNETGETDSPYNEYGELKPMPIRGVIAAGCEPLETRLLSWSVGLDPASAARSDESREAWTCVNNCTPDFFQEPTILDQIYSMLDREAEPVSDEYWFWPDSGLQYKRLTNKGVNPECLA